MAGGARTLRSVRVDASDSGVGPGRGIQLAPPEHLDHTAVALPAAAHGRGTDAVWESRRDHPAIPFHDFSQNIVEGAEYPPASRVMRLCKLLCFLGVAASAVPGGDDRGDPVTLVLEGVGFALLGHVAFVAPDAGPVMPAAAPLLIDRRILQPVAVHTLLGFL